MSDCFGFTEDEVSELLGNPGYNEIDSLKKRIGTHRFDEIEVFEPSKVLKYLETRFE